MRECRSVGIFRLRAAGEPVGPGGVVRRARIRPRGQTIKGHRETADVAALYGAGVGAAVAVDVDVVAIVAAFTACLILYAVGRTAAGTRGIRDRGGPEPHRACSQHRG